MKSEMNTEKSWHLYWIQDANKNWIRLYNVALNDPHFDNLYGVYIIWYFDEDNYPHIVRIGQGEVKSRLAAHRRDVRIDYLINEHKVLYATWAMVWIPDLDGVESYLGNELYT